MTTSFLFVLVETYCLLRQRCAKQAAVTLPRRELEPDKPARYYYSIAYAQFLLSYNAFQTAKSKTVYTKLTPTKKVSLSCFSQ